MNPLDYHVITFLNQFANRSWTFDTLVFLLAQNSILKTGLIVALLGWAWARARTPRRLGRRWCSG